MEYAIRLFELWQEELTTSKVIALASIFLLGVWLQLFMSSMQKHPTLVQLLVFRVTIKQFLFAVLCGLASSLLFVYCFWI